MGCAASSQVSLSTLQIITKSGKKFLIPYNKFMKVSQIKTYMEMRIAQNSDHLRLFLRIENNANTDMLINNSSEIDSPADYKFSIIQVGEKSLKQIELDDNLILHKYSKILSRYPYIYLTQEKPQNNISNESSSTSVHSNRLQKNQTINVDPIEQVDHELKQVIELLESGQIMTKEQIKILERLDCPENQSQSTLPTSKTQIKYELGQQNQLNSSKNIKIEEQI